MGRQRRSRSSRRPCAAVGHDGDQEPRDRRGKHRACGPGLRAARPAPVSRRRPSWRARPEASGSIPAGELLRGAAHDRAPARRARSPRCASRCRDRRPDGASPRSRAGTATSRWSAPSRCSGGDATGGSRERGWHSSALAARRVRGLEAEPILVGHEPTPSRFEEAARAAAARLSPDGDLHATAEYRRRVAGVLAERTLAAALARCGKPA